MHAHLRRTVVTIIVGKIIKFVNNTRYVDPMGTLPGGLKVEQDAITDL